MPVPADLPPFVHAEETPLAELRRVVQLLDDRLDDALAAVPARLRGLIPAALMQLAARRFAVEP
jgi:hypothetical protein